MNLCFVLLRVDGNRENALFSAGTKHIMAFSSEKYESVRSQLEGARNILNSIHNLAVKAYNVHTMEACTEYLKSEQQKTAHIQKLAINKKSTIFVQSIWNLVKIIIS